MPRSDPSIIKFEIYYCVHSIVITTLLEIARHISYARYFITRGTYSIDVEEYRNNRFHLFQSVLIFQKFQEIS